MHLLHKDQYQETDAGECICQGGVGEGSMRWNGWWTDAGECICQGGAGGGSMRWNGWWTDAGECVSWGGGGGGGAVCVCPG